MAGFIYWQKKNISNRNEREIIKNRIEREMEEDKTRNKKKIKAKM